MGDGDSVDPIPGVHSSGDATGVAATEPPKTNGAVPNPYETDPNKIPRTDRFLAISPDYGRYLPQPDDTPKSDYTGPDGQDNSRYWEPIVARCNATTRIRATESGESEVHAIGNLIIILRPLAPDDVAEQGSFAFHVNEWMAMECAKGMLGEGIQVPEFHYHGRVNRMECIVESRIPGVTLEVAWPYLSAEQKADFKQQTRRMLQRFMSITSQDTIIEPNYIWYVCSDARFRRSMKQLEYDLLFMDDNSEDLSFMHNNLLPSKIIVNNDRIVGLVGWHKAGWFGWDRARNVHRQIRAPEYASSHGVSGELGPEDSWDDLYDIAPDQTPVENKETSESQKVKTEPVVPSLEKVPVSATAETASSLSGTREEPPTPKKIADLKRASTSRASSSERSSPSAPNKPAAAGNKRGGPSTGKKADKKGTATAARKPAPKKRKMNSLGPDSKDPTPVAGRRSGTPVSHASKTPAPKNQKRGSASLASSPAPKPAPEVSKRNEVEVDEDDEESGDGADEGIFCICRKPDNHTWMIGCDGGCEDWFHGECVGVDKVDSELIDKYFCPNCEENGKGYTTWKPMCRLPSCRQPARVQMGLSKYCSDEHGKEFMRAKTQHLQPKSSTSSLSKKGGNRQTRASSSLGAGKKGPRGTRAENHNADEDSMMNSNDEVAEDEEEVDPEEVETEREELEDLGSRGGVLTGSDLKAVVSGVESAKEFRKLGDSILSPLPAGPDANNKEGEDWEEPTLGLDFNLEANLMEFAPDDKEEIAALRNKRDAFRNQAKLLHDRERFITLVRQRAKTVVERLRQADPKGGWKDICGYDSRLAWSDDEFDQWRKSDEGKNALTSGVLDAAAQTTENEDTTMRDAEENGDNESNANNTDAITRGVCIKKRCERHKQWVKVEQQNNTFEQTTVEEELLNCKDEARVIVEKTVARNRRLNPANQVVFP